MDAGILGALARRIKQLVLAGLATTRILHDLDATFSSAFPCSLKMVQFIPIKSLRSIPCLRAENKVQIVSSPYRNKAYNCYLRKPPKKTATSTSFRASSALSVIITPRNSGYAPSSNSKTTPARLKIMYVSQRKPQNNLLVRNAHSHGWGNVQELERDFRLGSEYGTCIEYSIERLASVIQHTMMVGEEA